MEHIDWKLALNIGQIVITVLGFLMLKLNDFVHLTREVKKVQATQEKHEETINTLVTNVAVINERCASRICQRDI